jgi:small-conductance mechanosensitive channel
VSQGIIDSLFLRGGFSPQNFPDLFYSISIASFMLLVAAVVLYNVQTRRLHEHPPLVGLQEWLFWTALSVFGLLIVYAIFKFYFVFVLLTLIIGLATFIWIRFYHFPPLIESYNKILARQRSVDQTKYHDASATIRKRSAKKSKAKSRKRR